MFKPKSNLNKILIRLFLGLQVIGAIFILSVPLSAMAAKVDLEDTLNFTPQVTIPDSEFQKGTPIPVDSLKDGKIYTDLLPRYIGSFYNYGLAIVGILATIILMGAGLIWLTSGGDSGKISKAKNLISGSIVGLIILLISWTILNTINPKLVNLQPIAVNKLVAKEANNHYDDCCCKSNLGTGELSDCKWAKDLEASGVTINSNYPCGSLDLGYIRVSSADQYKCEKTNTTTAPYIPNSSDLFSGGCEGKKDKEACTYTKLSTSGQTTVPLTAFGYCQNGSCQPCLPPGAACGDPKEDDYKCASTEQHPTCGSNQNHGNCRRKAFTDNVCDYE